MCALTNRANVMGVTLATLIAIGDLAWAADVGPFGPPLGSKAKVIKSFNMKTSGALAMEVKAGKDDEKTGLIGQCNPAMFANFGILQDGTYDQAEITIVSKDPIKTGMTGEIKLDKVWVRFMDLKSGERMFGGKGVLKLSAHEAAKAKRRMTGTIVGTKLEGSAALSGKSIDVTAAFDMEFSCGVL